MLSCTSITQGRKKLQEDGYEKVYHEHLIRLLEDVLCVLDSCSEIAPEHSHSEDHHDHDHDDHDDEHTHEVITVFQECSPVPR